MMEIPTIDLGRSTAGPDEHRAVVAEVDAACREVGFLAVVDPEFPGDLRTAILDEARRFFDLPTAEKESIAIAHSDHHRGYAGLGGELLQPGLLADHKETLDFGSEVALDDPDRSPLEGPSQWPDLAGFRDVVLTYQAAALETAKRLLRLMAEALDVEVTYFDQALARPLVIARMVHYPPAPEQVIEQQLGCGAHSDYGCVTVLLTDGVPGLQLQDRAGVWHDITAPPGAFVINFGDMLERWTNGRYRATPHRVVSSADQHRYSIPVFTNPSYDWPVETFASCAADGPGYPPTTAGAYLEQRFDETFAYRTTD